MEARLPLDTIRRITDVFHSFQSRASCTKRELLSLLGHLNFACRVNYPGRAFVFYLIRLSCTVKVLHHHVKITNKFRLDLRMWSHFLQQWNGISFFLDDDETTANKLQFYMDSTPFGFEGNYNGK